MFNFSERPNYMGTVFSLVFGFSIASAGWNGELIPFDLILFLPVFVLGMMFPRTIGISMVGVQIGSIFAALFSLIRVDVIALAVSAGTFFGAMLVSHLITILRPRASLSVGAIPYLGDKYP